MQRGPLLWKQIRREGDQFHAQTGEEKSKADSPTSSPSQLINSLGRVRGEGAETKIFNHPYRIQNILRELSFDVLHPS